jgi:hypothetical protein
MKIKLDENLLYGVAWANSGMTFMVFLKKA